VEDEPETLSAMAAKIYGPLLTSSDKDSETLRYAPPTVQTELFGNLGGDALLKMIRLNRNINDDCGDTEILNICVIQEKLTQDDFQSFLLNLHRQIGANKTKKDTRITLNFYLNEFAFQHFLATNDKFNASIAALGFIFNLDQLNMNNNNHTGFYHARFQEHCPFKDNLPVATIPKEVEKLVLRNSFQLPRSEKRRPSDTIGQAPWQEFFFDLTAMVIAYNDNRIQEIIAYGGMLLCKTEFLIDQRTSQYFLFVWGMMAVACAKLSRSMSVSMSCLFQVKQMVRSPSSKIEYLLFKQSVCANYRLMKKEKSCFLALMEILPTATKLFENSVMVHIKAKVKQIEDIFFLAIHDQLAAERFYVLRGIKKTEKLTKLIHKLLSREHPSFLFQNDLKLQLSIVELFNIMFNMENNDGVFDLAKKLQAIKISLDIYNHHVENFLHYHETSNLFYLPDYIHMMDSVKIQTDGEAKQVDSVFWADICFTHYLLFAHFKNEVHYMKDLLMEALRTYQLSTFNSHGRINMINLVKELTELRKCSSIPQNYDPYEKIKVGSLTKSIDLKWILQTDHVLAQVQSFGVHCSQHHCFF